MKFFEKIKRVFYALFAYRGGRCAVCGRTIFFKDGNLCPACENKLTPLPHGTCISCKAKAADGDMPFCRDCHDSRFAFDGGISAYVYDEPARKCIWEIKYRSDPDSAKRVAGLMSERLKKEDWFAGTDLITGVPVTAAKLKTRTFNQSYLISGAIADKYDIIQTDGLLTADDGMQDQIGLSGEERFTNASGHIKANREAKASVAGKTVLICDDVFTTGATLSACAVQLKALGAEKVYFATFAAAINKKREVKKHETSD